MTVILKGARCAKPHALISTRGKFTRSRVDRMTRLQSGSLGLLKAVALNEYAEGTQSKRYYTEYFGFLRADENYQNTRILRYVYTRTSSYSFARANRYNVEKIPQVIKIQILIDILLTY